MHPMQDGCSSLHFILLSLRTIRDRTGRGVSAVHGLTYLQLLQPVLLRILLELLAVGVTLGCCPGIGVDTILFSKIGFGEL